MSSLNEEGDEIYQVPRSSLEIDSPAQFPSKADEEDVPPALMPKRGSGFKRTSSLLDRLVPNVSPQPPPRNSAFNRNSSVDLGESRSEEARAESLQNLRMASRTSSTKSLDLTDTPLNHTSEGYISKPTENLKASAIVPLAKLLPTVSQQSAVVTSISDSDVSKVVDKNTQNTASKPSSQTSSPAPPTRPVPRPRTKVPSPVPQNLASNSATQVTNTSLSLAPNELKEQSPLIQNQPVKELPPESEEEEEKLFKYSLPPDADSIESMLNDEVDKKYGLHLAQNKETEPTVMIPERNHATSTTNFKNSEVGFCSGDESNEYVNPDSLKKGVSLVQDDGHTGIVPASPKPHSAVQTMSYLHMNKQIQQGKTSTVLPSQRPALPQRKSPSPRTLSKIDIGSVLFGESSSDDISVSEEAPSKGCDVNPCPTPTTPKPFNDIKPFRSKVLLLSDTPETEKQSETKAQIQDFSDFDPLWGGKPKSDQASGGSLMKKLDSPNLHNASSGFVIDWKNVFTDSEISKPSDTMGSTYATPDETLESSEAYYSQIGREPKNKTATRPLKSPSSRQSFHYDAPLAPPPPLPRHQNRIPEPKPPPVPPRPDNAPSHPLVVSQASPTTTSSFSTSPACADIFQDLPTPSCIQGLSTDPFQDTNFEYECLKFKGKTQVPAPPSRSPLSQMPAVKFGGPACKSSSTAEGIDPRTDPERISRFVIPPPSLVENNVNAEDYDLARELSSSDSESADFPIRDNSMQGWPAGGLSVATPLKVFDGSLLPKKTSRYGYLYKQGGYKANKGWKKRWVVFNGTSLSYYSNNTAQVSKRIIPVRCIVSIEQDVKETDKNSFKFKVVTSLKDRVFIFSSDTLDDCITWASILMAAITEYKRSFSSGEEVPPDKPDKEGFIKFSNMKKYYVTITGKTLSYYQSFEDYQMGSPIHEIDMKLCSVKVKDHKKLQLWIHYGHFDMAFESDQEMQQWRMAMEDAIAEGLADDTVLNKVYENLSNHNCADCNDENPHWASINLGIVVCKNCAGVHRMFDYRVSKIRSLRMDTRVWTTSLIEIMVTIGNANANAFWEFELPFSAKIQPTETMDKRKEFITKKYRGKKFCNLHPLHNCGPELGEALINAARSDDVLEMMRILFSGVDVLLRKEEHGPTAYDVAKEHGQRLIMELLYQNGGDPQSLEQDVKDENRLREDIRLQGLLNKAGPIGRTFEKRWCILEHGALTYYINEKSKTFKGSVDRKDMYMIQAVDTDRICYTFELSTGLKDNRIFTFSSESRDECGEWIRTIAKLMAPVAVMDHVGMIDIKLAGYVHMKESFVDEWRQTFIVFSWRGINYMNRDLKFDNIDLRKASSIKMQDSGSGYQQRGQCFVISSTGKSVYLQATLARDTEKMFIAFLEASTSSGSILNDQALTNENVPVIVERCITHVHMNGLEEKGIYRTAGQNSKVQVLLDDFRKDAWSVSMSEYTVQDVANVLKRFLRELDDSVFERINYGSWINMAGCQDKNNRLMWYKYYLEKMPLVNYQTLKRIILHLLRVSESEKVNLMSITNLASCFAPSLLRTAKDEQPSLASDASSKEISIVVDLISNADYFFNVNDNERIIRDNIQRAENEIHEIQKRNQDKMKAAVDSPAAGILTPVHLLSKEGHSINILVTETKTAKEAMDDLKRHKAAPDLDIYVLHEQLFKGALERPLFPEDMVAMTTKRWAEWENWVMEDNCVCLYVQGTELLEKLQKNFNSNHVLLSKQQYCEAKPRSRFKRKMVGFRHCKLALYSDSQGSSESISWNVEDITIYLGTMHKKSPPPTRYCLTFTVNGEKYTKPPFGHCLSFDTEDELYRWAAAMYTAQHPAGLLSWQSR